MMRVARNPAIAAPLFVTPRPVIVQSCIEGAQGRVLIDREPDPRTAAAVLGDFAYLAGARSAAFLEGLMAAGPFPVSPQILIPCNPGWTRLLEEQAGHGLVRHTRYATMAPAAFDCDRLRWLANPPEGTVLQPLDASTYALCRTETWSCDLVSQFPSAERFDTSALGVVALASGRVVSGASTYARSRSAIEIEVDTHPAWRRRGLARACSAALILSCAARGIRASWDAHTEASLTLARQLGYALDHAYTAYLIERA